MWTYIWSVNGKKIEAKPQLEFFSEEDAGKNAELCKPILKKNDKAELEVSSEYKICIQRKHCRCEMVLFEILKGVICELRHHNCEACQISPPVCRSKRPYESRWLFGS